MGDRGGDDRIGCAGSGAVMMDSRLIRMPEEWNDTERLAVLSWCRHAAALKSLTVEQVEALAELLKSDRRRQRHDALESLSRQSDLGGFRPEPSDPT